MKKIYFITGNEGKVSEIKEKVKDVHIEIVQKNLGYPEIQGDSLEEVVQYGIDYLAKKTTYPFIIEDAGLFINSLQGFPGVYSKYVYYTIGCRGILKLLDGITNRTSIFRSVYGYFEKNVKPEIFIGECFGSISKYERGKGGFGYDPIFIPHGQIRTYAEMSIGEKNSFSHRGKALDRLLEYLNRK
jgi:XTP/dITP diphosphohydrolase